MGVSGRSDHSGQLTVTVGDVFVFTAIFMFGPEVAASVAIVEAVTTNLRLRIRFYKQAFNLAQIAVVAFVVGHIFYKLVGTAPPLHLESVHQPAFLLAVGLCGLLYFMLSTGLLAAAMAATSGNSFVEVWQENFVWTSITHLAGASLGAVICIYFDRLHFYSMAIVTPILCLLYYAYKMNFDRIQQAHQHVEQVNALLQEKIAAERELNQAKEELELRVREWTAELRRANQQLLAEIRERQQAETALAAEKEQLSVTLGSIADGVITTDTSGRVVLLNAVAEELTGFKQAEAAGRSLTESFGPSIRLRAPPTQGLSSTSSMGVLPLRSR